jgi:hypothetical protein
MYVVCSLPVTICLILNISANWCFTCLSNRRVSSRDRPNSPNNASCSEPSFSNKLLNNEERTVEVTVFLVGPVADGMVDLLLMQLLLIVNSSQSTSHQCEVGLGLIAMTFAGNDKSRQKPVKFTVSLEVLNCQGYRFQKEKKRSRQCYQGSAFARCNKSAT